LPEKRSKDHRAVARIRPTFFTEEEIAIEHSLALARVIHLQHRPHKVAHQSLICSISKNCSPDAHEAYETFRDKKDGCVKVVIRPNGQ
jgi:threonine dehydrogenase-like Zn-dependent dehydrogenase